MRRKFAFGLGLAGVLSGAGVVVAQFAADRAPALPISPAAPLTPPTQPAPVVPAAPSAPPALPAGVLPPGGGGYGAPPVGAPAGGYVAPVGGIATPANSVVQSGYANIAPLDAGQRPAAPPPANLEIRSALGPNHPWAVRPEHGAFFICVKSYSRPSKPTAQDAGPSARVMAEELATEIRDLYRVQAFLYEYVSEERKAEMAAIATARARAQVFASQLEKYRQEAQLKGMVFMEDERVRVHYKTVEYRDQIAVLVGGFKSEEDARAAIDLVRRWAPPKNKNLMDGAAVTQLDKTGKPVLGEWHMNPYLTAHVVPNPTVARAQTEQATVDPYIIKINEGRPYNLLNAKKGWTLAVKSFTAPVEIVNKDTPSGSGGFMKKVEEGKGLAAVLAGAEQAEKMAEALRKMTDRTGRPLDLEAFVFHSRSASIVTVGQFDSPNDPELIQLRQLLSSMQLKVSEDRAGSRPAMNAPSLFGNMMPIPVPRRQ